MKHIYLLFFACFAMNFSFAQNVNIPDPVFKTYLLSVADINNDGEIQFSEAAGYSDSFEVVPVDGPQIFNLTGLEAFVNAQSLEIWNYGSTSIDVSNCPQFVFVGIHGAPLTSINLTQNINLMGVIVVGSQITSIDLSASPNLQYIDLYDNQLANIILPSNTNLKELWCYNNQLTSLNMRNGYNESMEGFSSVGNPNLQCIYVDDASASYLSSWSKDASSTFVNNEAECALLSIEEGELISNFKLYPNPVNNQFNIKVLNETKIDVVEIFDVSGKSLMSFDASESYSISDLSSGVYFVKVKTDRGEVNKRIIKN